MPRDIVIFERDERFTDSGEPELDFRLVRGALPAGSSPLAIANHHGFVVECGQWFGDGQIAAFAEEQSGYRAARVATVHIEAAMERLADPMAPDYDALAAEEPTSQNKDSRDAAEVAG